MRLWLCHRHRRSGDRQDCPTIVGYYDLNGKLINGKQRGAVIVRYSDGTTRKVLVK